MPCGYKRKIVTLASSLPSGEIGALLRREGLYSSHLTNWRHLLATHDAATAEPKRGRKADAARPQRLRIEKLERELARSHKRLAQAEAIIGAKKVVCAAGSAEQRGIAMSVATALSVTVGTTRACAGLGMARATWYRQRRPKVSPQSRRTRPLQLVDAERAIVLDTLMSSRFLDYPPAQVYAILLDEGRYLCSIRTMYRLLASVQAVRERRDQRPHPVSVTAPALPYLLHPCNRMRARNSSPRRSTTCGLGISPSSRPR